MPDGSAVPPSSPAAQAVAAAARPTANILLILVLVSLVLPFSFEIGGLRLSPYRLLFLILLVPLSLKLLTGQAGRLNAVDAGMFLYVLWMGLTLVYHHGAERIPYAGVLAVETFGAYLSARVLIRSVADFRSFMRTFYWLLLFMLPLGFYELVYSRMPLSDFFRPFFTVVYKNQAFRMGFSRVQVAFPHAILFGLFCSIGLASAYYLYRDNTMKMLTRVGLVLVATALSLSSAPVLSVMIQTMMIAWDKVTKSKWWLLAGLIGFAYAFLETFSNRGAVVVFIETLTFDPATGWWRVHIWRYGSDSVMNHPIFGIGLNDWERPDWLSPSVDNFWLLTAMRHGIPGFLTIAAALAYHAYRIIRVKGLSADEASARTGYMVTFFGLIFVLATVHIWDALAVFVMFFFGLGAFFYTMPLSGSGAEPVGEPREPTGRQRLPYSRFQGQTAQPNDRRTSSRGSRAS